MDTLSVILSVHAVSTILMTGVIWFVQVVHYPLFHDVGELAFKQYEVRHTRRTTWVVAPVMIAEALSAVALLFVAYDGIVQGLSWVGACLLALIWASTAWLQVPCHRYLSRGFDAETISRLVMTNWIRTVAWTARSLIALAILLI